MFFFFTSLLIDDPKSSASSVGVCDKKVAADEALDFSADHVKCVSANFELDPNFSEFDRMKNSHKTVLQAVSMSGAPLGGSGAGSMPPTSSGSMPAAPAEGNPPVETPNDTDDASIESPVVPDPDAEKASANALNFPTAAPTPLQSIGFDGSPPTIEKFNNDTAKNTTWFFGTEVPIVYNQTIQGFKYPTVAPTAYPTMAGLQFFLDLHQFYSTVVFFYFFLSLFFRYILQEENLRPLHLREVSCGHPQFQDP